MTQLISALVDVIDSHREQTFDVAEDIFTHPELGFREHRTSDLVASRLAALGLPLERGLAVTGVRAVLEGGNPGPTVALLAELDGIRVPGHPCADASTHAAHACGHHAQVAALLAAAEALVETNTQRHLCGRIVLMAVPAEEYGDMAFRTELRRKGAIGFLGGKSELIRLGAFDDVDIALMIHTGAGQHAGVRSTMNGFVAKRARFTGRAAHAGCAPHEGINALNAASLALQAIHAQRETFADEDHVRVHPILHHGGSAVNVVPADIEMEMQVRAATMSAVRDAARKVDRSLLAGALALGADVLIETLPGYMPLANCHGLNEIFRASLAALAPEVQVTETGHRCSSTDMGDVSQIMPAMHPHIGGAAGTLHGPDFRIEDPELAYALPAKVLCACAVQLLGGKATRARTLIRDFPPAMSKSEYLDAMASCWCRRSGRSGDC